MNTLFTLNILISAFGLVVLAYFVHVNKRMSPEEKKTMMVASVFAVIAAFANLFSTMMNGDAGSSHILHGLLKAVEHSMAPMLFIISARVVKYDKIGKYLTAFFNVNALLQFVSVWTGWAFTIDAANVYHAGVLNAVTYLCSFLGFSYELYVFYNFSRTYKKNNAIVLVLITVLLWAGVAVHLFNPDIQVIYICTMLSLILVYIYMDDFKKQVQDEEIAGQLNIMDTLTLNYECVYKVDIETHCFEALRVSDFIGKQFGAKLTPDTKYETGMEVYCSLNVYAADREMFMENTRLAYILESLRDSKSYSFGYRILRDDRTMFFSVSAYKMFDGDRLTHILIGFADVDEQRRRWENLMKVSTTDQMTGVYNRRAYNEELERIDKLPQSEKTLTEAVMMDLNGLKQANDTYGHEAGDELIVNASSIMEEVYGKVGKIYRLGGDEFVVIANIQKQDSDEYVKKLKGAMNEWKGIHIDSMSGSVGTARIDETQEERPMEEVVKVADTRMYEDKAEYYKLHDRRR